MIYKFFELKVTTFFSATFHVISRKIDFLWDSEVLCAIYNTVFLLTVLNVLV